MAAPGRNLFARTHSLFWQCFLIWTAVGAVVIPFEIEVVNIERSVPVDGLREALVFILRISDALWMVLAFGTVYASVILYRGVATARLWAVIIIAGSALIETVGEVTGFPFGPYAYTDNMGARIGGILPFTIPLAWFVIIASAMLFMEWWKPEWPKWKHAAGVGIIATLTDLNLEFIAWKVRAYWIWYPPGSELAMHPPSWPPIQNYMSWFAVSFLLAVCLPVAGRKQKVFPYRPVMALAFMNALFLLVHLVRAIRLAAWPA